VQIRFANATVLETDPLLERKDHAVKAPWRVDLGQQDIIFLDVEGFCYRLVQLSYIGVFVDPDLSWLVKLPGVWVEELDHDEVAVLFELKLGRTNDL
jgi:hypothetical protein